MGGRGRLSSLFCFSFGDPLWEGPRGTGRESDPPEGWIHRSTAFGVFSVQASSLAGTSSLWDFGWEMGEGDGAGECLCSPPPHTKLCSVVQGSTTLPPVVLQPSCSPSSAVNLYTFQMLSPTCCPITLHPAPPLLQAALGGSAWPVGCPSAPAPSC